MLIHLLQWSNNCYILYKPFIDDPHLLHWRFPVGVHTQNPTTVPEAVRRILTQNYPIYQCLKMKLTNFHSIAEHIQPEVVALTGRKPSINTLVVAIKRFSDGLEEIKTPEEVRILEDSRISLS